MFRLYICFKHTTAKYPVVVCYNDIDDEKHCTLYSSNAIASIGYLHYCLRQIFY